MHQDFYHPGSPHLVHEHVEVRVQRSSVPAAHGDEAEAHPHVEPLADAAAPRQSSGLLLLLTLRGPACTQHTGGSAQRR